MPREEHQILLSPFVMSMQATGSKEQIRSNKEHKEEVFVIFAQ